MPSWVSAPAVLYDGVRTVFLIYAVNLPNGDGRYRDAYRCALVSVQVDQTGPYTTPPEDVYIIKGARCNTAPLIIRNAYGRGNHAVTIGGTDGMLYVFPASGFKSTGPILVHDLKTPLPIAIDGNEYDNYFVGVSGNFMAANSGGSIAMILHNGRAQEYWFGIVSGVMYQLPTDVTPSPSPRPAYQSASATPSPIPQFFSDTEKKDAKIAGAVLGTLGGLAAVAGAIVYFAPTAAVLGVVPAELIKSGAGAVYGGVTAAGSATYRSISGLIGSSSLVHTSLGSQSFTSSSSPQVAKGGERLGLLSASK